MKNIAIYGGAFDPPHIGHIQLINHLTKIGQIDQIWLMPCGDRTDKQLLLPKEKRFTLMRQIFINNPSIKVSDHQVKMSQQLGREICTYDLFGLLKKQHTNAKFHMVIGGDIVQTIGSWGHSEKLITENSFIVFHRKGYDLDTSKFPHNQVVQIDLPEISSSYLKKILLDKTVKSDDKKTLLQPWLSGEVIDFLVSESIL